MPSETVKYRRDGRVAYITLNRPRVLNAVNKTLEEDLARAFNRFDLDDEAWVAIIHGEGRAFCAGADVKERFHNPGDRERDADWGMGMNPEGFLGRCINWKPVIAAIHGHCLAYGMVIAAECDLIVATEETQFGLTETLRGFPGGPAWAKVETFMPSKVATEMILTGQPVPAQLLYDRGLHQSIGSHRSALGGSTRAGRHHSAGAAAGRPRRCARGPMAMGAPRR